MVVEVVIIVVVAGRSSGSSNNSTSNPLDFGFSPAVRAAAPPVPRGPAPSSGPRCVSSARRAVPRPGR